MGELDQYDYDLPRELIAQSPLVSRADARLLVVDRPRQVPFPPSYPRSARDAPAGDCLVLNETRVIPARLVGRRRRTGGHWEGLFLESDPQGRWRILCKARGKLLPGETIVLLEPTAGTTWPCSLRAKQADGSWIARPDTTEEPLALLERVGRVPLPPYIRKGEMVDADRQHYQTVYARCPGAVAAPTAGLHFTEAAAARGWRSRGLRSAG